MPLRRSARIRNRIDHGPFIINDDNGHHHAAHDVNAAHEDPAPEEPEPPPPPADEPNHNAAPDVVIQQPCLICYQVCLAQDRAADFPCRCLPTPVFHITCLRTWFLERRDNGNGLSCPQCRHEDVTLANNFLRLHDPVQRFACPILDCPSGALSSLHAFRNHFRSRHADTWMDLPGHPGLLALGGY